MDPLSLAVFCNCFELLKTITIKEPDFGSKELYYLNFVTYRENIESGIDIGQGINVGPGKFGKKNKKSNLEISIAYGKIPKK